jgi:hypothetical protein
VPLFLAEAAIIIQESGNKKTHVMKLQEKSLKADIGNQARNHSAMISISSNATIN